MTSDMHSLRRAADALESGSLTLEQFIKVAEEHGVAVDLAAMQAAMDLPVRMAPMSLSRVKGLPRLRPLEWIRSDYGRHALRAFARGVVEDLRAQYPESDACLHLHEVAGVGIVVLDALVDGEPRAVALSHEEVAPWIR